MARGLAKMMEHMGWRAADQDDDLPEVELTVVDEDTELAYPFSEEPQSFEVVEKPAQPVRSERRRIVTVHPRSFGDAQTIGESFRAGTPVIMNLTDLADDEARRVVDFAAGLSYGLHGNFERVTDRVFLISPKDMEISRDGLPGGRGSFLG